MSQELLDDQFFNKSAVKSNEDIMRVLGEMQFARYFEHKNGSVIVEEGDAVKIALRIEKGGVEIKQKFPSIGNSVQVLISALLLAFFLFVVPLTFPLPWILAIAGGQIASYLIYKPKTERLKERIERHMR